MSKTSEKASFFAQRITHFLRGYRRKNALTQDELAKKIGTTKSTISRIENNQDKQIANLLGVLSNIATLENLSIKHFLDYLEHDSDPSRNQIELYPWQKQVLASLAKVRQSVRLNLVAEIFQLKAGDIEPLLQTLVKLSRLEKDAFDSFDKLLDEFIKLKK